MFEHTKQLEKLNTTGCRKLTGKKFLGKFFADQSSRKFAGFFFPGDIGVLANCPGLKHVDFSRCKKLTGKGTFFETSLETSPQECSVNFLGDCALKIHNPFQSFLSGDFDAIRTTLPCCAFFF